MRQSQQAERKLKIVFGKVMTSTIVMKDKGKNVRGWKGGKAVIYCLSWNDLRKSSWFRRETGCC